MAAQKLTLKQERFVTEYLKSGNATDAADKAGYKQGRQSLAVQAYENLRKPNIRKAIEQALTHAEITPEWILLQYKELATTGYGHNRLRALEDLSRAIELTGFKSESSNKTLVTGPISISFGPPQSDIKAIPSNNIIDID